MSASNWSDDDGDLSTNPNIHYRLDNVGLQIGLGLPLQILSVPLVDSNRIANGSSWTSLQQPTKRNNSCSLVKDEEIQQTVDGIPIRKVYITNIHIDVQRREIYKYFGHYGTIMNVFLSISKNDSSKQFAFITYADPKDAARVLSQRKFLDVRGHSMFATAADSWHQPKKGRDGKLIWKPPHRGLQSKQEEESEEEDDQSPGPVTGEVQIVVEDNVEGLNILNDDCLLHIFSFLSFKEIASIERVCKRWQALSYRMWRCLHELDFTTPPLSKVVITTPILEQYLRRCGESLTLLDLSTSKQTLNDLTLVVIAKYCSNLEVLRVAHIHVGNRALAHLGRRCPGLKELVMDGCAKFNDKDLMSLLPKCYQLSHLHLSNSAGVSGRCLANIPGPINSLKLCNCPALDTKNLIAGLQKMSNTLESLSISACNNLRSSEVVSIVSTVPNLTSLSLSHLSSQLDSKSMSQLSQLTKLTTLNLALNSAVNDTMLAAIAEGCGNLTSINLCGSGGGCVGVLSERGLSMIARLRKLTDLDLSYLQATNSTALKNISARSSRLKRFICRGCPELSDDGSIQVVTMCNELEVFDLSGCNNVGEDTVTAAITSVKMRTNNVPLKLIVGGTKVDSVVPDKEVPLLTVDLADLCVEHMRPDFMDDMFFPPSDSDEEDDDDIDHLCERIGCDCDFDFDDLYDPTLFPSDFEDDTPKFGALDDSDDMQNWVDLDDEYSCTWKDWL